VIALAISSTTSCGVFFGLVACVVSTGTGLLASSRIFLISSLVGSVSGVLSTTSFTSFGVVGSVGF